MRRKHVPLLVLSCAALSLLPLGLSDFFTYGKISDEVLITPDANAKPVCYLGSAPKVGYVSIALALRAADALVQANSSVAQTVYVIPGTTARATVTETQNLKVNSGVTLVLPYADTTYKNSDLSKSEAVSEKLRLNLQGDLEIENGGVVRLGGYVRTTGISGPYSTIYLSSQSSITVKDGGTFECYGLVAENNQKHNGTKTEVSGTNLAGDNGIYDNSNDKDRFIKIRSGGTLISPIYCYGVPASGSTMKSVVERNICPFNIFDFSNLQTFVTLEGGAIFKAAARLYMLSKAVDEIINIVHPTEDALFKTSAESSFSVEWCNTNLTRVYISGNVTIGHIIIPLPSGADSVFGTDKIDTKSYYLPISYRMHIFLYGNGVLNVPSNLKLLPGSVFKIEEGSKLNLQDNAEMIAFEKSTFQWVSGCGTSYSYAGADDALLINNGEINLTSPTTKLAGFVYTESTNPKTALNMALAGSQDNLYISTVEGIRDADVASAQGSAYFVSGEEFLKKNLKAKTTVNAYAELINDTAGYQGDAFEVYTVNIRFHGRGYTYPVGDYEFYISETGNDSDQKALTGGPSTGDNSFTINAGNYIKIVADSIRLKRVSIDNGDSFVENDESEEEIACNQWITPENMTVNITASEGVRVTVASYKENETSWGSAGSGNGAMLFTLYESVNGGSYNTLGEQRSVGNWNVVKGARFYMTYTHDDAASGAYWKFSKTYYAKGAVLPSVDDVRNGSQTFKYNSGNAYLADECYRICNLGSTSACLLPGTLITMSEGPSQPIETLRLGDAIIAYDFFSGSYTSREIIYFEELPEKDAFVVTVCFDDGTELVTCDGQGYFDLDRREYFVIRDYDKNDLGRRVLGYKDGKPIAKTIINIKTEMRLTKVYEVMTAYDYNFVANGILTVEPTLGCLNVFEIDETLKYNKEKMEADIMRYGLYEYKDVAHFASLSQFRLFNIQYWKIMVEKGWITFEEIEEVVRIYKPYGVE